MDTGKRGPGRPRSVRAHESVLEVVVPLIEAHGYGALTIEALARRAGVSKQTIYRWWDGKAEIVMEALEAAAAQAPPTPDSGSVEQDVRAFMSTTIAAAGGGNGRLLAGLMAEAQLDETFAASFRERFLARRLEALGEILERGRGRGEIAASADVAFLAEIAFAALWYRLLVRNAPLDGRFAGELTDVVLKLAR
jgi:AcrR family transcriptional regulator